VVHLFSYLTLVRGWERLVAIPARCQVFAVMGLESSKGFLVAVESCERGRDLRHHSCDDQEKVKVESVCCQGTTLHEHRFSTGGG